MADIKDTVGNALKSSVQFAKRIFSRGDGAEREMINDFSGGYDAVTVSTLLGSGKRQARSRAEIYQKWHYMAGDPIVSSALRLHVTAALGGHETTGDTVFIETSPEAEKNGNKEKAIIEEIQQTLGPIFNRIAHQVAFNGCAFGDAYGRVYSKDKVGVQDVYVDEMVYPPLLQPYEKGNSTVGYMVSTGQKMQERLTIKQVARMKMPRLLYVPQIRIIDKAIKTSLVNDDIDTLPVLPSLAGGSFMDAAEESFDNLTHALIGLVSQRILSSIDENMVSANTKGMTKEQRKEFMASLEKMLKASKARAEKAVKEGKPIAERIFHIMPTFDEKQLTQVSQFTGTSGSSSMTVDDVLFHAKLLSGSLGIDLSMLGFADLMSGGLGEGGFFRTSAQAAEKSRIIRTGLTGFFNEIIDIHTYTKYGFVFQQGKRPVRVNFYGSISALESEQQNSRQNAMNGTAIMVSTLEQLKNLNFPKSANRQIIEKNMEIDADMAETLADAIEESHKVSDNDGAGGGFGGGGGLPRPAGAPSKKPSPMFGLVKSKTAKPKEDQSVDDEEATT